MEGGSFVSEPSRESLRAIDFVDSREGWALSSRRGILRTANGGRTWNREWGLPLGTAWSDGGVQMDFTSRTVGWLLVSLGEACMSQMPYVLYYTHDGGHRWIPKFAGPGACGGPNMPRHLPGIGGYPGGLSASGGSRALLSVVAPASADLYVVATEDGGSKWTHGAPVYHGVTGTSVAMSFVSGLQGWVVTGAEVQRGLSGRILHTQDGGRSWMPQLRLGTRQ